MAAVSSVIAAVSLVVGTALTLEAQSEARQANRMSRDAQAKAASENKAQNAADAARERRSQVREERVRRARILQSGANTGSADSSGELGAQGSLSTQLASNIGANLGRLQTANNLSIFGQQQADAQGLMFNANQTRELGGFFTSNAGQLGSIGGSIFDPKKTGP